MILPLLRSRFAVVALLLAIAISALAASGYKVTLPMNLTVAGTKLKAGDYTVTIEGKQAIFKKGKETFAVPVDVEKADKKFSTTSLELAGDTIKVIDLGGTDNMLVFQPAH